MDEVTSRLLILEDDDGIRSSLRLALEDDDFEVIDHADAASALAFTRDAHVDAMLVDLMLGGIDGFSFIRRVRGHSDAPIIVISALEGTQDIVSALESGADDYVTKPFVIDEVRARVRAMLRRPSLGEGEQDQSQRLVIDETAGPLVLDPDAGTLSSGGEEIHLTTTEFRLLSLLAENAGRVLSRRALLEQIWSRDFFGDERIVDVHIRRLRRKIEKEPSKPQLVVTVRGLGYRLDTR
jgi:DNA-binding response OmpR family regulator